MSDPADSTAIIAAGGLQIERDGALQTIWLSRPDSRNSQTPGTWRALALAAQQVPDDVSAVVIRGRGTSFSSGLDRRMFVEGLPGEPSLAAMAGLSQDEFSSLVDDFQRGFTCWRDIRPIVVAAVHGHAIGAGFQLALAADFIIASDDAVFSMKEAQLGLVPDLAGTKPLADAVGYSRALEICATGREISAAEGETLGFVARRAPEGGFEGLVAEVAAQLAATPGQASVDVKHILRGVSDRDLTAQRERERRTQHGRVVKLAKLAGAQ